MSNKKLDGTHVYHISGSGIRTDEQLYEMAMAEFKDEFYFELKNHRHYKKMSDLRHEVCITFYRAAEIRLRHRERCESLQT